MESSTEQVGLHYRPHTPRTDPAEHSDHALPSMGERLVLRDGGRMLSIAVEEIEWIEAAGNYVEIHTGRKSHLVRHTVKAMEAKLDPAAFLRVRPSAIVKVVEVASLRRRPSGDYVVVLRDGTEIPSSRGFRDRIERVFGKPSGRAGRSGPDDG